MIQKTPKPTVGEILQGMFAETLSALVEQGELPPRTTVQNCGVHLMFAMLSEYFEGNTPVAKELEAIFEALRKEDDEVVRTLGVMERQAVWGTLSMLNNERKRRQSAIRSE